MKRKIIRKGDEVIVTGCHVTMYYDGTHSTDTLFRWELNDVRSVPDILSRINANPDGNGRLWYIRVFNKTLDWCQEYNYCQRSRSLSIKRSNEY